MIYIILSKQVKFEVYHPEKAGFSRSNNFYRLMSEYKSLIIKIQIQSKGIMATKSLGEVVFNNKIIPHSQIFLMRKNVFGLINHKPCVQGHVLICSRRIVPKIEDLTEVQTLDLFLTAQQVTKKLQTIYNTQYDLTIQNGKSAGQTVFHCHVHLYPKHQGDVIQWKNQEPRSEQDMAKQAQKYRGLFQFSAQ